MKAFQAKSSIESGSECFTYVKVHPETWEAIKKRYSRLQKRFSHLIKRVEHFYTVELCAASERIRNLKNGSYKLRVTEGLRIAFRIEHQATGAELLFGRIVPHDEGENFHRIGVGGEFRESVVFAHGWEDKMTVDPESEDPESYFGPVYRHWDNQYLEHLNDNPDADLSWFLDERQSEIAGMSGPVLLSGSAGSGKTTIAIYRLIMTRKAREEAQLPPPRQLYVTFSESLRDYAARLFDVLSPCTDVKPAFVTVNELCRQYADGDFEQRDKLTLSRFKNHRLILDRELFESNDNFGDLDLIWREIRGVIKGARTLIAAGNGLPRKELTYDEYLREATELPFVKPANVYEAHKRVRKWMRKEGLWDDLDLAQAAYEGFLAQTGRAAVYDEVVVDEAQDLTNFHIALLWKLCPNEEGLFLAGDTQQAIHPSRFSWQDCLNALYDQGRPQAVVHLKNNYRCPAPVVEWANAFARWRSEALLEKDAIEFIPLLDGDPIYRLGFDYPWPRNHYRFSEQLMVIVPNEDYKRDAANVFGDGFVFTVAEAKGLEREFIVLWRCIEPDYPLWQKLGWSDAIGYAQLSGTKPFAQHILNCWNIAITRTRTSLFVVDDAAPEWSVFLSGHFANDRDSRLRLSEVLSLEGRDYAKDAAELEERELFRQAGWKYKLDGRWQKAAACFRKEGAWEEAAQCFELAQDKESARVFWRRAAVDAEANGRWKDAEAAYAKCGDELDSHRCGMVLQAKLTQLEEAERAKRWGDAGGLLEELKRFAEAAQYFEQAKMLKPAARCYEAASNWHAAAWSYDTLQDWPQALRCFERVGDWAEAGRCAELVSEWVKAGFYFEKAMLYPQAAFNFERKGLFLQAIRLFERSEYWLEAGRCYQALAIAPDASQAKKQDALERAGICFDLAGEWQRASECYKQARCWSEAGDCFGKAGNWEEAGSCYEQGNLLQKAALAYERAGRWSKAGAMHQKLNALPQAAECFWKGRDWYSAGRCFHTLEEWERAGQCYALSRHWLFAARMYQSAKNWDEAAAKFELARDYQSAAEIYDHQGRWLKAAACYSEAKDWPNAARCHEESKNWAAAGDCHRQARNWLCAKRCSQLGGDWFNVGVACDQLGEFEESANCYAMVDAFQEAANALKRLERWEEAIEFLSMTGNWQEVAECYVQLDAWGSAAPLFQDVGLFGRAAACYEEIKAWYEAAECHKADGNTLAAAKAYEQAAAFVQAGSIYRSENRYEDAGRCFEFGGVWLDAAECYAKPGKNLKAAQCYERAEKWLDAARLYKRELTWAPAAEMFVKAEAWSEAAGAYVNCGEWHRAGQFYMKCKSFSLAAKYFGLAGSHEDQEFALRLLNQGPEQR